MATLRNIIADLIKKDYDISYYERSDGGLVVTQINGTRYRGKEGNKAIRAIVGAHLSQAKRIQLKDITRIKKGEIEVTRARAKKIAAGETFKEPKKPGRKRVEPLSKEFQKELRKLQKTWRTNQVKAKGKPTTKRLRQLIKEEGEEEALRKLRRQQRYAEGYAYEENVSVLLDRLNNAISNIEDNEALNALSSRLENLYIKINSLKLTFKEAWISDIYNYLYDVEKGIQNDDIEMVERAVSNIESILKT